jgi:hypothetical protein
MGRDEGSWRSGALDVTEMYELMRCHHQYIGSDNLRSVLVLRSTLEKALVCLVVCNIPDNTLLHK